MKTLHRILKLSLWLCAMSGTLLAQQNPFKYRSAIAGVDSAGYYRINFRPELTARAKADLSDIRIAGPDGAFVAYVKKDDIPENRQLQLTHFPPVTTTVKTDTSTVFVVQNPTDGPVNNLWVWLKNTVVKRHITINGSDDLHQWFAISENMDLGTAYPEDSKGVYRQQLFFPASSYRYLQLVINNEHKNPLNIIQAGVYNYLPAKPMYVALSHLTFTQADSPNHVTHIYINFDQPYPINRLFITVNTKAYFHREMNIYTNDDRHEWLTSKTFSNADSCINLSVKTKRLDVQIINNDDRPLPITKVEAAQAEHYVVARLEAKKTYYLLFGDEGATAPRYDLQFFTEKLAGTLPETGHFAIEANPAYKTGTSAPVNKKPYLLWLSIAVAVAILSALTVSMTKQVEKRKG